MIDHKERYAVVVTRRRLLPVAGLSCQMGGIIVVMVKYFIA